MIKKILFGVVLMVSALFTNAAINADTISIDNTNVTKWISDTTINSKGKQSIKYYCIYKGQLINTNKTTIGNVKLCNKYKVKCALILITSANGRKRIICN